MDPSTPNEEYVHVLPGGRTISLPSKISVSPTLAAKLFGLKKDGLTDSYEKVLWRLLRQAGVK